MRGGRRGCGRAWPETAHQLDRRSPGHLIALTYRRGITGTSPRLHSAPCQQSPTPPFAGIPLGERGQEVRSRYPTPPGERLTTGLWALTPCGWMVPLDAWISLDYEGRTASSRLARRSSWSAMPIISMRRVTGPLGATIQTSEKPLAHHSF